MNEQEKEEGVEKDQTHPSEPLEGRCVWVTSCQGMQRRLFSSYQMPLGTPIYTCLSETGQNTHLWWHVCIQRYRQCRVFGMWTASVYSTTVDLHRGVVGFVQCLIDIGI